MDCYVTDYQIKTPGAAALEDSVMRKGSPVTAGSKIMEGFDSPFDATVVERLREAGIAIAGVTRMAEFGLPAIAAAQGGLSGAVQAVQSGAAFCLCNDLFGQYRREAAQNGLCYIHPTYGTVSRYGLIPVASSMDQIGVLCRDVKEGFALLSKIAGKDERDGAMLPQTLYTYAADREKLTVSVPAAILSRADEKAQAAIRAFAAKFDTVDKPVPHFDMLNRVQYALACAEISNNINRYDGVKFGYRSPQSQNLESLYLHSRTEGFGLETKLAAIMGSLVLSAEQYTPYYEKAMKIRRLVKQGLDFDGYDLLLLPVSLDGEAYGELSLFAAATLAGLPSVSFTFEDCGLQLIAKPCDENALYSAWEVARS